VIDFLALPWLRSIGYNVKTIDTDTALQRRWKLLSKSSRGGLEKNHHDRSVLSIKSPDFSVGELTWGKGTLRPDTDTYLEIQRVCEASATQGYFCYDEMFVWANDLLKEQPNVESVIRNRFPLLLIDEAQDNSNHQSVALKRIFLDGNSPVVRQRFGDGNQAIFDSTNVEEVTTDKFPIEELKKSLPDSHRFGQKIADLADPLGVVPYELKGKGPKTPLASKQDARHTIFLFDETTSSQVFDSYGELLVQTFSEQELSSGTFSAVGHIHTAKADSNKPRHVGHYWPEYDPQLAHQEPHPETLAQYFSAAVRRVNAIGETHFAVETFASGLLRLSRMANGSRTRERHRNIHRYVLDLLADSPEVRSLYEDMILSTIVRSEIVVEETWRDRWRNAVLRIATSLAGCPLSGPAVEGFLAWPKSPASVGSSSSRVKSRDNFYRYPSKNPKVEIKVGSIHSIKGETHTATLVLETFWYTHNLESLLPWLDGRKLGGGSEIERQKYRLKLHYVAMTRPTHLLCLAMKKSTFVQNDGTLNSERVLAVKAQGWEIHDISTGR